MRTTVRLDDDLLRRAKIRAAAQGTTLTALIEAGLEAVLGRAATEAAPKHAGLKETRAPFEAGFQQASSREERIAALVAAMPRATDGSLTEDFHHSGVDINKTDDVLDWLERTQHS